MAKKKGHRGGKDKGREGYGRQAGLGPLRRANAKARTRTRDLQRHAEDHTFLDQIADVEKFSDSGEGLLAKFNRLTRVSSDAIESDARGAVAGFDGRLLLVRDEQDLLRLCEVRRVLKKMLSGDTTPLVVGDLVRWRPTADGEGVITAVEARRNQLARADSHNKALQHVFAANIDRLLVVGSLAMPELKTGLIDRYLTIAHYNNIEPWIVINKCDLGQGEAAIALYRRLGYQVFPTVAKADHPGIVELRQRLAGLTCVVAGQSGVGKSSLIQACFPDHQLRIGAVSDAQRKGRHTTTASRSYLAGDGRTCIIDTPGIRECGITGMTPLDVALLYPDIAALQPHCRFTNCQHIHEPDCAVQTGVDAGAVSGSRYLSYLSIVNEDLA